ncbi:MAG: hypothetical protein K2N78_01130, partial [Oscillospiraceae bacterium]|nr:hypothetical protein [Oscillospiraceae bacterium]
LTAARYPSAHSLDEYVHLLGQDETRKQELIIRNMELLRGGLFSQLDHMLEADAEEMGELSAFAAKLYDGRSETDLGLFCSLHQTMLNLARQKEDRDAIIRELYWLGIGRHAIYNKLGGLPLTYIEPYLSQVRLCFAEAAAYLKYFEEIENEDSRSYIMRSMANMALGQFKSVSDRTRLIKKALQVLQDPFYQELAPQLPWERFVRQTRQLMISSLTFSREHAMSPQDVADIMESAHIVYRGKTRPEDVPLARQGFHLYSIEYYCGIYDLNTLLTKLEYLMAQADIRDYSREGMYTLISLPAFYSQYLHNYPEEMTPTRERYAARLYQRVLSYVEAFPEEKEGLTLFTYLRQLSYTFVETERSITYASFQHKMMARFAPEIYLHARAVGSGAMELCGILLEEEPAFFDDMEEIRALEDPAEKRKAVLDLAEQCGLFHDMGKMNLLDLYTHTARQWFPEEYELSKLHTVAGYAMLSARPSTARLATSALGHHSWYDGSQPYPGGYKRLEHPERQMIDVICLIDWLVDMTSTSGMHTGVKKTFDEAIKAAIALEGKRFSPMLTARLRDPAVVERIRLAFDRGTQAACREMPRTATFQ